VSTWGFLLAAGTITRCIVLEHNLLDLNSTNMLDLTGTSKSLGADFRESKVLDLTLLLQLLHLFHCLLNRRLLIYAVAVVKIDTLDAKAFQRLLASFAAVLGSRVCLDTGPVVFERQSELRGQEDLLALAGVLSEPVAFEGDVLLATKGGNEKFHRDLRTYLEGLRCLHKRRRCPRRTDRLGTVYREL
jgi:hypothetical protein